jgi:hypothetical protein
MSGAVVRRDDFAADRQGKTFADVLNDPDQPLDEVLTFLSDEARQRRMEEAEIHHDRPPLAGVVRELESHPTISRSLCSQSPHRSKRLRQAIGVAVRMIMERRGWKKTGKKGSLGVRTSRKGKSADQNHNTGGLAFWFLRAERYQHQDGMPFLSVRERLREFASPPPSESSSH